MGDEKTNLECEACGRTFKQKGAFEAHIAKHITPGSPPQSQAELDTTERLAVAMPTTYTKSADVVSKQEFSALASNVEKLVGVVSDLASKQESYLQPANTTSAVFGIGGEVKNPLVSPKVEMSGKDAGADETPVPPKWRQLVNEILGEDFGVKVNYPESGSGFLFTIIVPREKSNATKEHWEMFKNDLRTRSISGNEGSDGVRKWVELVKKNLSAKR